MLNCSFEILHARWAMLAAFGALVPEILDLLGAFHFVEPVWWRVGYSKLKVSTFCVGINFCLVINFSLWEFGLPCHSFSCEINTIDLLNKVKTIQLP